MKNKTTISYIGVFLVLAFGLPLICLLFIVMTALIAEDLGWRGILPASIWHFVENLCLNVFL